MSDRIHKKRSKIFPDSTSGCSLSDISQNNIEKNCRGNYSAFSNCSLHFKLYKYDGFFFSQIIVESSADFPSQICVKFSGTIAAILMETFGKVFL